MAGPIRLGKVKTVHVSEIKPFSKPGETACGKDYHAGIVLTNDRVTCGKCLKKLAVLPRSVAEKNGVLDYVSCK